MRLLHDFFRFFVCALQKGYNRADISILHSPTILAEGVISLQLLCSCMHQAVWWFHKLDGMVASPGLTERKSLHTSNAVIVFACVCTSGLHAADNAKAS